MKKEFRVWCHRTKSWLHNETTSTHVWSDYSIDIFNGKLYEYVTNDGEHFYKHKDDSEFTIHLWTGLYDKNGKKIFEGDILLQNDLRFEIRFESFQWVAVCPYYNKYHHPRIEHFRLCASGEVIGNIMENPELLKA